MNAEKIAKMLDVEVRDGWYYVADIVDVDGNPWIVSLVSLKQPKTKREMDKLNQIKNFIRGQFEGAMESHPCYW